MRRLIINLDDDLDLWLGKQVNQNETVRKALKLYKEDITTPDTIEGLRQTYKQLTRHMKVKFEYYDLVFKQLEKLINVLETRM